MKITKTIAAFAFASGAFAEEVEEEKETTHFWPGNAPWADRRWCGSQMKLPIASNSTCVIMLNKGTAAWVNAGGLFITNPSVDGKMFEVHTYDNHAEGRSLEFYFTVDNRMTENNSIERLDFNKWGQPIYPEEWKEDCYMLKDKTEGLEPAGIACNDLGGPITGVFMSTFAFNKAGTGTHTIQVKNTDGHAKDTTYEIELNNSAQIMDGNTSPVPTIDESSVQTPGANTTVTVTGNKIFVNCEEEYTGELLPVQFKYADAPLTKFEPAQAFYSSVKVV